MLLMLLPLTALPPATVGVRCAAAASCALAMREAACEAAAPACYTRRSLLLGATLLAMPTAGVARTPGSEDVRESVDQIRDAAAALRKLRQDWSSYAIINSEGRAGNIDAARRILGGVSPQRGEAARLVAEARHPGAWHAWRMHMHAESTSHGWRGVCVHGMRVVRVRRSAHTHTHTHGLSTGCGFLHGRRRRSTAWTVHSRPSASLLSTPTTAGARVAS